MADLFFLALPQAVHFPGGRSAGMGGRQGIMARNGPPAANPAVASIWQPPGWVGLMGGGGKPLAGKPSLPLGGIGQMQKRHLKSF